VKKPGSNTGAFFQNDGPADRIPVNLDLVPDAIPQSEPLIASANKPYSALGMSFRPDRSEKPYRQTGKASWYGKQFHGRKTSSGERYDMFAMTAAHPTLPIPSYARVTNVKNGESVIVRINDRGPFHRSRLMDLSYAAAHKLNIVRSGSGSVVVERVFPVEAVTALPPSRPHCKSRITTASPTFCNWALTTAWPPQKHSSNS
jgi:rare lipoprotein A